MGEEGGIGPSLLLPASFLSGPTVLPLLRHWWCVSSLEFASGEHHWPAYRVLPVTLTTTLKGLASLLYLTQGLPFPLDQTASSASLMVGRGSWKLSTS